MNEDWLSLKKELDRLEGRVLDFGSFSGCRIESVPHDYLLWCLAAVPLRAEVRRTVLRVLARSAGRGRTGRAGRPSLAA
jgi:hypothetical protein